MGTQTYIVRTFRRLMTEHRSLARLLLVAFLVHFCLALVSSAVLPEMRDVIRFKLWANRAVDEGIHRAYSSEAFWYDWLPLYLYVSKVVGLAYRYSGLSDLFGPYSRVLALGLKTPMILLHLLTGGLVYLLAERFYGASGRPSWAAAAYLFNPAIALTTSVAGYQEALHTALIVLAAFCLCTGREGRMAMWATLAFLAKPQAAIFLPALGVALFARSGVRGLVRSAGIGLLTALVALAPFILYGEFGRVVRMFCGVTNVHPWLSGCAHNIWWIVDQGPPFASDREPLILGINGLTIGLSLLSVFSLCVLWRLLRRPSPPTLVHLCAFLGLGFFMLSTEMHENYLYAMFPFLAVFAYAFRPLGLLYAALTVTSGLNIALTLWLLNTGSPVLLGPVRVSIVNALVNVALLLWWGYLVFARDLRVDAGEMPENSPESRVESREQKR